MKNTAKWSSANMPANSLAAGPVALAENQSATPVAASASTAPAPTARFWRFPVASPASSTAIASAASTSSGSRAMRSARIAQRSNVGATGAVSCAIGRVA